MKKILSLILALMLICTVLISMGVTALAAAEGTDIPAPTDAEATPEQPTVTPVPEPPAATPVPDTSTDAGDTDTHTAPPVENTDPAAGPDDGGTVTILGITTVPAIMILCLLIGYGVKVSPLGDEYIPLIVGVAGGIIGFIAYHVMPDFPGNDPIVAIAIGVASGLAATGVHQAVKQLKSREE